VQRPRGPSSKARPDPRRQRRSLANVGGPVEVSGPDEQAKAVLVRSLDVAGDDDASRAHVHGFHSYPARLHPTTARRLIEGLSAPGATVLDPFCGSGTVLVEGRLADRKVQGVDANPLAIELSWLKTRGTTSDERAEILRAARAAAESADERRKRRAGATRRYGSEDVALFEPHVLLELDGLRAALRTTPSETAARALRLVLSSILVKVSRQPGDTSQARGERRLASGFTLRLFQSKADELVKRLAAFEALLPESRKRPVTAPIVRIGDARQLEGIRASEIDLVVTSPPYPGTYDYVAHHAPRLRWLELDARRFADTELGARRNLERLPYGPALARFQAELGAALAAMTRVLRPSGAIVLIVADSILSGRAVHTDRLVRELAQDVKLDVTAIGSQARPHFHGPSARAFDRIPRREHAIVCRKATSR
jgi:hypothetical protein